MLVLTRKESERIRIGDDISIVVVELRGDRVRLGIEAPRAIPVHREEVASEIRRETPPPPVSVFGCTIKSEGVEVGFFRSATSIDNAYTEARSAAIAMGFASNRLGRITLDRLCFVDDDDAEARRSVFVLQCEEDGVMFIPAETKV